MHHGSARCSPLRAARPRHTSPDRAALRPSAAHGQRPVPPAHRAPLGVDPSLWSSTSRLVPLWAVAQPLLVCPPFVRHEGNLVAWLVNLAVIVDHRRRDPLGLSALLHEPGSGVPPLERGAASAFALSM